MVQPLTGIRVLDFTMRLFGPSCTQALGDFGAEVVKVEPPGGEPNREARRPSVAGFTTDHLGRNRNKKSIAIDLRREESKPIIRRLVETSDVVIHNYRPGVPERLGLTYEELSRINPRIIYAMGSGYGPTGPYAWKGGQDRAAQALSGVMSVTGDPDGPPVALGPVIIDFLGGMLLAQGVLLAILARQQTGRGQRLDVSLLDAAIWGGMDGGVEFLNTGVVRQRKVQPLHGIYQTSDSYVQLIGGFARGNALALVCSALGIDDLTQEPRFATRKEWEKNGRELRRILEPVFRERTSAEWVQRMDEKDLICAPVYTYGEVFDDPQVKHNQTSVEVAHPDLGSVKLLASPVKLSETPATIRIPPPRLGQHTDEVLRALEFSEVEIAALRNGGVVL